MQILTGNAVALVVVLIGIRPVAGDLVIGPDGLGGPAVGGAVAVEVGRVGFVRLSAGVNDGRDFARVAVGVGGTGEGLGGGPGGVAVALIQDAAEGVAIVIVGDRVGGVGLENPMGDERDPAEGIAGVSRVDGGRISQQVVGAGDVRELARLQG